MFRRFFTTKIDHHHLHRSAAISFKEEFYRLVGKENVLDTAVDPYVIDWTGKHVGGDASTLVIFPRSTAHVSAVLSFCHTNKIGVVPQGGNTGLVGGSVPLTGGGELVLSMAKMNSILSMDKDEGVMVAEAGCVLENMNTVAAELNYLVPLDLGAKGSCMIGGNVSTNAGGLRVIRYGSMHQNVLGLEVVQADGTVLNMLRQLPKDNCGYPLKHLFIGAEGTLGVITKVAIALAPLHLHRVVAMVKVSSFDAVSWLLRQTQQSRLSSTLSAFEFIDPPSLSCMARVSPDVLRKVVGATGVMNLLVSSSTQSPARGIAGEVLVLMEFSAGGNNSGTTTATGDDDDGYGGLKKSLEEFLGGLMGDDDNVSENTSSSSDLRVLDALVSQSRGQEAALWSVREHVPVSLMQLSRTPSCVVAAEMSSSSGSTMVQQLFKYDVSLKLSEMDGVTSQVKKQMQREGYYIAQHADDLQAAAAVSRREILDSSSSSSSDDNRKDDSSSSSNSNSNDDSSSNSSRQRGSLLFCCFGHAGDKNLHLNVVAAVVVPTAATVDSADAAGGSGGSLSPSVSSLDSIQRALDRAVYKAVLAVSGSVSAEHGANNLISILNPTQLYPNQTI